MAFKLVPAIYSKYSIANVPLLCNTIATINTDSNPTNVNFVTWMEQSNAHPQFAYKLLLSNIHNFGSNSKAHSVIIHDNRPINFLRIMLNVA